MLYCSCPCIGVLSHHNVVLLVPLYRLCNNSLYAAHVDLFGALLRTDPELVEFQLEGEADFPSGLGDHPGDGVGGEWLLEGEEVGRWWCLEG